MTTFDLAVTRVVVLSPIPWAGLWTSRHEIARTLAERGALVDFVDPPATLFHRPEPQGAREHACRLSPPNGLRVLQPPARLPYGVVAATPAIARHVIAGNAARYARFVARHCTEPSRTTILFNSFMPVVGHRVAGALRPTVHVYHRADELRAYESCRPLYLEVERDVLAQADVVVCVSDEVRAGIVDDRPDAVVVRNGVDNARFAGAVADPRITRLDGPVALLVGTIDDRVDVALLDEVVAAGASLVVAGHVSVPLPREATVLGPVAVSEVPGLMAAADVGLVPYRTDWPGDVLKTYEYLAAGIPVVATALPSLPGSGVTVAGRGSFGAAVREAAGAMASDREAVSTRLRSAARTHDWSARVDDILALVERLPAAAAASRTAAAA